MDPFRTHKRRMARWLSVLVLGATVPPLGAFMPCVHLRNNLNAVSVLHSATPWRLQRGCGPDTSARARLAPLSLHATAENIRTPESIAAMMEDAAGGILAGVEAGVQRMAVEVHAPALRPPVQTCLLFFLVEQQLHEPDARSAVSADVKIHAGSAAYHWWH